MAVPGFLQTSGPIALAHRGASNEQPENTMAAFDAAVRLGFSYIETDVHVTADGVLVAFHDDRLDRVTSETGRISAIDWSEAGKARLGGEHRIPRLEELLTCWPDLRINLDPKSDAAVGPLIDLIRKLDIADRVCIGSFSGVRINRFRKAFGTGFCTSMGPTEVLGLRLQCLPFRGLPGAWKFAANCVQVPVRYRGIPVVDKRFVAAAHQRGLKVHVWTINDEAEMHHLLDMGVDGLISDEAALLKSVFVKRGLWL